MTLKEEATAYVALRQKNLRVQAYAEKLADRKRKAALQLYERMESEGIGSLTIDGIGSITRPKATWYASVTDRVAFQEWAQRSQPSLLLVREQESLLNKLVRSRIDDNRPLPPGLSAYPRKAPSVHAAKGVRA